MSSSLSSSPKTFEVEGHAFSSPLPSYFQIGLGHKLWHAKRSLQPLIDLASEIQSHGALCLLVFSIQKCGYEIPCSFFSRLSNYFLSKYMTFLESSVLFRGYTMIPHGTCLTTSEFEFNFAKCYVLWSEILVLLIYFKCTFIRPMSFELEGFLSNVCILPVAQKQATQKLWTRFFFLR